VTRAADIAPSRELLLTSVVRPFGGRGGGDSVGAELFHAQVTRAQGCSRCSKTSAVTLRASPLPASRG